MKTNRFAPALLFICILPVAVLSQDAREIVKRADENMRANSSYSECRMTITKPTWSRTVELKAWALEPEYTLMYVTAPARWSLFQEFAYDLTPLIRTSLFGIYNPDDKSVIVLPSVTYSAATNLDLMSLGLINDGRHLTEFGDYYNAVVLRGNWSF